MQKILISFIVIFLIICKTIYAQTPIAGDDQTICSDATYLIANQPPQGTIGNWSIVSGGGLINNATSYNTSVSNISLGASTFRWSFNDLYDDMIITNNSFFAQAGEDQLLQTNNETYMTATLNDNATGSWSILAGSGIFTDPISPTTLVSDIQEGPNTFRWTVIQNNCETYDDVAIVYNPSSGTNIINKDKFKIYPLPASEEVTIEFPKQENYTVEIYSITGILIKTVSNEGLKKIKIDSRRLNSGLYHCNIFSQSYRFHYNIIIQK